MMTIQQSEIDIAPPLPIRLPEVFYVFDVLMSEVRELNNILNDYDHTNIKTMPPTVAQFKAYIKKNRSCPAYSKLKKADLVKIAKKLGWKAKKPPKKKPYRISPEMKEELSSSISKKKEQKKTKPKPKPKYVVTRQERQYRMRRIKEDLHKKFYGERDRLAAEKLAEKERKERKEAYAKMTKKERILYAIEQKYGADEAEDYKNRTMKYYKDAFHEHNNQLADDEKMKVNKTGSKYYWFVKSLEASEKNDDW